MRIIAGKFRGRRLKAPRGLDIRPTSDRLRESLFSILAPRLPDAVVLDVFAGTGAVGLEALSRGAREVVFVESSEEAVRLIRENLELCGVAGGYRLIRSDVFRALRALAREELHADLLFFDPPYRWGPYRDLLDLSFGDGLARPAAAVVIEHHRKAGLPEQGGCYRRFRLLRQSDTCLSFYAREEPPAPETRAGSAG